jgi:hypothetical protein
MQIADFDGLLLMAGRQPQAQRMLFVFLKTVTQKDYTEAERAAVEADRGGALLPMFCVDLKVTEVRSLNALVSEADQQSTEWDKMLVACMNDEPTPQGARARVDAALKQMVARVQTGGDLSGYLCFTRGGEPVVFE